MKAFPAASDEKNTRRRVRGGEPRRRVRPVKNLGFQSWPGSRRGAFLTETGADERLLNWLLKAFPTQPN